MTEDRATEPLRFSIAGSTGNGKSTLLERLLKDAHCRLADTPVAKPTSPVEVPYGSFSTAKRRFIVADLPGDEQQTPLVTMGFAEANVALIVVDARHEVTTPSRRHALIASLLGVPHLLVAVNKMDLVDYSEEAFEKVRQTFNSFSAKLAFKDVRYIPIDALHGDNVVRASDKMPWYQGTRLLNYLETVETGSDRNLIDLRMPVQDVTTEGLSALVASGVIRVGDSVVVLPAGKKSRVKALGTPTGECAQARTPETVMLKLEDKLDVAPGDMLARPGNVPNVERQLEAMLVWLSERNLELNRPYQVQHTTQTVRATISELQYTVNPDTLSREKETQDKLLGRSQIGRVSLDLFRPLMVDECIRNRQTGRFTVIDPLTNDTVGYGVVIERAAHKARIQDRDAQPVSTNITWEQGFVTREDRERMSGAQARTYWFTGLSGSGKSTIARLLEKNLIQRGVLCYTLDGDNVRHGMNKDLGFAPGDRKENIRRVAEMARILNDAGVTVIASFISPYRADRVMAREIVNTEFVGAGRSKQPLSRFVEVFIDTPLEECEKRDPKGLYKRARAGEIAHFTGISAPYEAPEEPELTIRTVGLPPAEAAARIARRT